MVGLLAIASVATRQGNGRSTAPPGAALAGTVGHHLIVVAALVLTPIVLLVGGALFVYAQVFRKAHPEIAKRAAGSRRNTVWVMALVAGLLIYHLRTGRNPIAFLHLRNPFSSGARGVHPKLPRTPIHHASGGGISSTDWTLAVFAWVALVAAVALILWRSRLVHERREPPGPIAAAVEPDEPDLESLRRERNPRRAVIAAYAAMERLMARDGLPRGVHEAPMEYLGRVTLHGYERVPPVHRLTGLFQRARFSHRPVDEDMRRRAIAAVEELADDAGDPA
jgi:Domain of unknown function (DUF4129)